MVRRRVLLLIPDAEVLRPERVRQALLDLGWPPEADRLGWNEAVIEQAARVRAVPGEPVPTWAVGEHRVRAGSAGKVQMKTTVCSCGSRRCAHVAAVLLVLAYNEPGRAAALHSAAWQVAFGPMAPPPPSPHTATFSHVRYDIRPPRHGEPSLDVAVSLVAEGPLGGRDPAPGRYPRKLADLIAKVKVLDPADHALHAAWFALDRARHLERGKAGGTTRHLCRALLEPLSRAADVRLAGEPVRVSAEPLTPRLVARRTDAGDLEVRFEPQVCAHWRQPGIVHTAEGEVRPLAATLPPGVAERLMDPLPEVPAGDVEAFVDRLVVGRGLAVDLPDDIEVVHPPDQQVARLTLSERTGHQLEVRMHVVYRRREGEVGVVPSTEGAQVLVPDEGLVHRDPAWERRESARFRRDLGADEVRVFGFREAVHFLEHDLPELGRRWEVFGRDGLTRLTVRGSLAPVVEFTEGEDWFDLDVRFSLEGRVVGAVDILRSWKNGERLHRLDDGSLARLPHAWLQKHGGEVDLLLEAHRAQRQLGSWHAWMASELLEGVGGPADHWLGWVRRLRALRPGDPLLHPRPLPEGFEGTLRGYQEEGVAWLRFLRDHGLHGVLADEMGLGKTVQALVLLADAHARTPDRPSDALPSLVVAPSSVLHNWEAEAKRFVPGLRVCRWHGARRSAADLDDSDVVVTTYALLRRDRGLLASRRWTWVVLDEAQQIKNPRSHAARAARALVARHRLALSGTPLENDLLELWSLFAFLMPGYLGRRTRFHARYTVASPEALDEFAQRIRPFLLRRRKAEVAPELPARTEVTLRVPLSDPERRLYERVRLTVVDALESAEDKQRQRQRMVLEGLTRLRQACCHPALLPFPEARRVLRSAKLDALMEQVHTAIATGSRCLVFSQWVQLLDRVAERLDREEIRYNRLQGNTRDRAGVVASFQDPEGPPLFLISTKAGGTGLNLTQADVVFHLDPWWNPQVEDQATARAHRIGQDKPVTVVRLVAANTVEDRVLALQTHKRALFDQTVEAGATDASSLTLHDLETLLARGL